MNKQTRNLLISSLILIIFFSIYSFYPILDCKTSKAPITRDTIYSEERKVEVLKLDFVSLKTVGDSMSPTIPENSRCQCVKKSEYDVNDVVFFFKEFDGQITGVMHRIKYVLSEDRFITKGDNNINPDKPINKEDVVCAVPLTSNWRTWNF